MIINASHDKEDKLVVNNSIRKPNFLIVIVDEQRYPPSYEDAIIKRWRAQNLKAQNFLRTNGIEFINHYAGSTACSPSRTTLYTGQYPSLHGVTQTDGGGNTAFAPGIFWLDPNTVPTFGDYLRTAGYDTFWKGKWHASQVNIDVPGTHNAYLTYDAETGIPIPEAEQLYLKANRLDEYGFNGWVGPEPHGTSPHNSASSAAIGLAGRDEVYSAEVVELLRQLEHQEMQGCSKDTKPEAQASYRRIYPKLFQPLADTEDYRRFYYSLQLRVDQEVFKVLETLQNSSFYENTIILYTSDHGDLLGSHGGLFQKWYQAYEEAIHVPLIIHNPRLVPQSREVDILTSHVDILPTLLGLAGIDVNKALELLKKDHTEAHPPVGRDLTPAIAGEEFLQANEPVYFMTDDNPSKNIGLKSLLGESIEPVTQPNHIETVIAKLPTGKNNELEIWKYSRYFDNPQFWSNPGCEDENNKQKCSVSTSNDTECSLCITSTKTEPVSDEIEMYNLTKDPTESQNLANLQFATVETRAVQIVLAKLLVEECQKKRLYPSSGDVPGKPPCSNCTPDFGVR